TALPLRRELIEAVNEVYGYLLATVGNTGEMGTIINWEQHLFPSLLIEPGEKLAQALGGPLDGDAILPGDYSGEPRMFVPEVRASLTQGEALTLRVTVLDRKPARQVTVYWRPLGSGEYAAVAARYVARGVWTITLPGEATAADAFEYYVAGLTDGGQALHFPVGAPRMTQSVVVAPPLKNVG
ncbi:MAG TPA: hypothetical protein VLM89_02705, partial [Phycisphaerae bacterium]|nr:hypothetical protein [Phycisphaerae bacterium]